MQSRYINLYIAGLLLVIVLIFLVQNMANVNVKFLFVNLEMPRSVLMGATLLSGMIIGYLARVYFSRKS